MHVSRKYNCVPQGQASVETLLLLPLLVFICLSVWQLLWLAWQAHTLQVASSYAARAGAIAHGDKGKMEATLVSYLTSTAMPIRAPDQKPDVLLATRLQLRQQLQFKQFGRLSIVSPSRAQQRKYQQPRLSYQGALGGGLWTRRWREIPVDHAQVRVSTLAAPAVTDWLAARQLTIDVVWCVPLRVPFAGAVIAELATWFGQTAEQLAATRTCALRQALSTAPLWPLQHRVTTPMLSGFYTASPS